jgi:hypothetical protein
MVNREKMFQTRMTDDEHAKLLQLAEVAGLTASDIVRLLVREAYALKFGDKKPGKVGGR